jgi:hypothetical protein
MKEIHTLIGHEIGQRLLEDPLTENEVQILTVVLEPLMPGVVGLIQNGELGRMIDYTGNFLLLRLSEKEQDYMQRVIAKRESLAPVEEMGEKAA